MPPAGRWCVGNWGLSPPDGRTAFGVVGGPLLAECHQDIIAFSLPGCWRFWTSPKGHHIIISGLSSITKMSSDDNRSRLQPKMTSPKCHRKIIELGFLRQKRRARSARPVFGWIKNVRALAASWRLAPFPNSVREAFASPGPLAPSI